MLPKPRGPRCARIRARVHERLVASPGGERRGEAKAPCARRAHRLDGHRHELVPALAGSSLELVHEREPELGRLPALLEPELSRECQCLAEPATSALRRASRRIDEPERQGGMGSARDRERRSLEEFPRELLRTGPVAPFSSTTTRQPRQNCSSSGFSFARQ